MKNDKLPIEYENSFLKKIKQFFRKLFMKRNVNQKISNTNIKSKQELNRKNTITELKDNNVKNRLKNNVLEKIDENPELLETASIKRLEEINMMYDEQIKENDRKIEYLKNEIRKLTENV